MGSTKESTCATLPADPLTVDTVEYDFENYALEHGIPETLDPLPYRKATSVFGGGEESEPVVTSAKNDPRLRTVVCRHWLRDLCMKGAACEFLHQYDLSKMPQCRHGDNCKIKDCPFRHISDADRLECVFYSQGFCIHGPFCRYKHNARERIDIPAVADYTLGLSQMGKSNQDGVPVNRPAPKRNEFYKVSLCKHFLQGSCPFGENCHFAHGEHELKRFPRKDEAGNQEEQQDSTSRADYYEGGTSGGGKPSPILEPEQAAFFIIRAATQRDLAISTVKGHWYLERKHAEKMNNTYKGGKKQIMIFFTVSDSNHIQGAALVTSQASFVETGSDFCYRLGIEWYRTCELPIDTALSAAPDLLLPTRSTQFCLDMTPKTGESVMKATWNSPLVSLYESWSGEDDPPKDILADFRAPRDNEIAWPTRPGPGFIFGCNSETMDECLGRGLLGLPPSMKAAAACIKPGASIFLFNVTDRLLFGVFEALTPACMNLEPRAFSRNPNAVSSPFPVQVRIRVSLECPPLEDTDPVLADILRGRRGGRIGALTHAQAESIASLLATQCGALQYMTEYKQSIKRGEEAQEPPIALPPKKIQRKQ